MGRLFGTNGVRGVVNTEITVDMIIKLAASAGSILGNEIVIGRDGRISSPMFRDAAISGLLSVGCTVHDAGMLPTPALQHTVKNRGFDGGIMVTASHNPPEFNGIKVIAKDGVEIPREAENEIEEIYFSGGPKLSPWNQIGEIHTVEPLKDYIRAVISHVNESSIKNAGLKVAVDPGNGVASLTAPTIARDLGCSVYTINVDVNGYFPARDSEPRPDNLGGLQALMEATESDVGVAFDGDGDRAIFVDEQGTIHWGDKSFALIAKEFLFKNQYAEIATPVSSSRVVEDVVTSGGGSIIYTRVGSVVVSRAMVNKGIMLGGEENGGVMYGPHLQVRDGSMALALILDIMAKEEKPLSRLFEELPQYAQMKDRVACPNELKNKALNALKDKINASKVETIDGVKLWYDDGSWILIRPSGTEPIFRLYAEAKNQESVVGLVEDHKKLVESMINSLR